MTSCEDLADPTLNLQSLKQTVFMQAKQMYPDLPTQTTCAISDQVRLQDHDSNHVLSVRVTAAASVTELCQAEAALQGLPVDQVCCADGKDGTILPGDQCIAGLSVKMITTTAADTEDMSASDELDLLLKADGDA